MPKKMKKQTQPIQSARVTLLKSHVMPKKSCLKKVHQQQQKTNINF